MGASVGIISRWQIRKRRKRRGESRQGCQGWTIWPRASYVVVRSDDLLLRLRRANYSVLEIVRVRAITDEEKLGN